MQLRLTIDAAVCPDVVAFLAALPRDTRRMAAIQLLRDGVFYRRWATHSATPGGVRHEIARQEPAERVENPQGWQPVCVGDPMEELGLR